MENLLIGLQFINSMGQSFLLQTMIMIMKIIIVQVKADGGTINVVTILLD